MGKSALLTEKKTISKTTSKATRAKKASPGQSMGYATQYANQNGLILDGQAIARNNRTYSIMYRINPDIRRCLQEIQQTTVKSGYELRKILLTDGKEKVVNVKEFEDSMKASGGFRNIKADFVRNFGLFGNVFIRKFLNVRETPVKYEILDSRYMSIITDTELTPMQYQYNPPVLRGSVETFQPKEILHIKDNKDFDNPVFGISILETLVLDVMGDQEASLSNYYYFGNDSIPSALFVLKEGMNLEQSQKVFDQIKETLQGGHNKHKNIVSGAVTDVKPIRADHNDMGFREQRKFTTERICAALGVPRTILGYIEDVNHSNGESQYEKFIENTIRPWERILEETFTELLEDFASVTGAGKVIFVVNDEHIDDLEQRSKLAQANVASGLWTRNEARIYLGYETFENEFANELTVPTTTQLLDNLANGAADQTGTPTEPLPAAA